jgi:hypothetical protein
MRAWLNRLRRSPVRGNTAAKVDFNVDLTHMLCEALLLPPLRYPLFCSITLSGDGTRVCAVFAAFEILSF